MSYGKKWKMTRKQMGRNPHSRRWRYHVCGGYQFKSGTLGTVKVGVRIPQSRQGFWMDKDAVPDSEHKVNGSRSKT